MKTSGKRAGGGARARVWWREKIKYGGGAQYFPQSSECHNPQFLPGFNANEIATLECLTFVAWKKRTWEVKAAVVFLEEGLAHRRIRSGAIKRHLKKFESAGLIKKRKNVRGNRFLVTPVLMQTREARGLRHYAEAAELALSATHAEEEALRKAAALQRRQIKKWSAAVKKAKEAASPIPPIEDFVTGVEKPLRPTFSGLSSTA